MGETHGTSLASVLILTRDGRALCAYSGLTLWIAKLLRDDLRHWLVGSRWLDYQMDDGTAARIEGEEVEAIEVVVQSTDA